MTDEHCRTFESLLAHAADGTLGEAERVRLDRHLSGCASCRAALAEQQDVRRALQARPALRAQPAFAVHVLAAIEAERSWLDRLDFRTWTWRLAPAAVALFMATWAILHQAPGALQGTSTSSSSSSPTAAVITFDSDLPVSAALWQDSVTDTAVLSLMLRARADDRLADAYKEP